MRSTNMFYGYKRLSDQRMYGVARRHNDSLEAIAKTISALIEKAIAFCKRQIDSIKEKLGLVEEPRHKKILKKLYSLSAKLWKNLSENQKILIAIAAAAKLANEIKGAGIKSFAKGLRK